jgi:hypothetical protein
MIILNLIKELKEKNEGIKKIDLKDKREEEKVKVLVLEGVMTYSEQIENLISSLRDIKMENLEESIGRLNILFNDFTKKSRVSYEKATILIGREMATIKDSLKEFFNELAGILEESKELIRILKTIKGVEIKISRINNIEKEKEETDKNLKEIGIKLSEISEKEKIIEKEIEEIKKSAEYLMNEKERNHALENNAEIENEILTLKKMIDFKELERIFHSDEKKMNIIKKYKEDFNLIFDNSNEIISLINKKKEEIEKLIKKIAENKKKVKEILNRKDESKSEMELAYLKSQEEKILLEKEKEEKRALKNQENLDLIKKEIFEELLGIGVGVSN